MSNAVGFLWESSIIPTFQHTELCHELVLVQSALLCWWEQLEFTWSQESFSEFSRFPFIAFESHFGVYNHGI